MRRLCPNGFIIQDKDTAMYTPNHFNYIGVNSLASFPLCCFSDELSRSLVKRQQSRRCADGKNVVLEFISERNLLEQYLFACQTKSIPIRLLFVESFYRDELWNSPVPDRDVLGFEYCPIPIDEQIISDIDWYPPLRCFWAKLNTFGLFNSYQEAKSFQKIYDKLVSSNQIGDGIENAYIMRVSVVNPALYLNTGTQKQGDGFHVQKG